MSVILIGMPSSGKSTVGVILAKRLGYKFIDSDLLIQERTGELLYEIIEKRGAEGFIELESLVNSQINDQNSVISTGGSAVYGSVGMEHLRSLGKIVYLEISYREMVERLGDYEHRGIVMKNGSNLRDMYNERRGLYEKYADITVRVSSQNISSTIEDIVKKLENT